MALINSVVSQYENSQYDLRDRGGPVTQGPTTKPSPPPRADILDDHRIAFDKRPVATLPPMGEITTPPPRTDIPAPGEPGVPGVPPKLGGQVPIPRPPGTVIGGPGGRTPPIGGEPAPGVPPPPVAGGPVTGTPPIGGEPAAGTPGYKAAGWTPQTRDVDAATETVAGQLDKILASDSPILQRARARANEDMNARGLLNSSLASTAALDAVLGQALNIANPDAQAYQTAARENQAMRNQAGQFNAAAETDAARFVAAGDLQKQTQVLAAQLDTSSRERLMAIEQNYRNLTNSSAAANATVQEMNARIGAIMADPAITPENKQIVIERMIDATTGSLRMIASINGLDFGNLLNFARPGGTAGGAPGSGLGSIPGAPPPPAAGGNPILRGIAEGVGAVRGVPSAGVGFNNPVPTTPPPGPNYRWVQGSGWVYSPQG